MDEGPFAAAAVAAAAAAVGSRSRGGHKPIAAAIGRLVHWLASF